MLLFQLRYRRRSAGQFRCHDIDGQRNHTNIADFGYQRHGTGCPRIGLQNIHFSVLDGILHIHQTFDMHLFRNLSRIFFDRFYIFLGNVHGRQDTCRVAGMYAGQLDMLHYRRNESMGSVTDGVGLALGSMA